MTHDLSRPQQDGPRDQWPSFAGGPDEAWAFAVVVIISATALLVLSAFFDARLTHAARGLSPAVVAWGYDVSDLGKSGYMFALAALVAGGSLLARRVMPGRGLDQTLTLLFERAVYILATLAASGLAAQLVKHLVGRARPTLMDAFGPYHFDMLSMKNSLASFPSGHATTAFAMAVALGFIFPRWRVPLIVLAILIAVSRIIVQAHYASDIVAGGALGTVSALVVAHIFADRSFAFVRDGARILLKGRGSVAASSAGLPIGP